MKKSVAIVTGTSQGIGRATAIRVAAHGGAGAADQSARAAER
jgi:NAD(P)-dependent dehydrogenase (short-subunit alcohol dehydrogenase family)